MSLLSALPLATLATVFLTTSIFTPNTRAAGSSTAKVNVGVTVLPTCSVGADVTSHTAEFTPGTYKTIGGETTFTISCNSSDGWSIYAVGNSGTTGAEGDTNLVGTSSNIATGTATSGNTSNWSFKLSSPSSGVTIASGYNANSAVPATRTKVISRESGTTAASTGDTFKASYAAYVSQMQAPDTYKGAVKYILFRPATVATRTMQSFSCSSLGDGQQTTLIDSRDNNPYTVAKLKDGKCWTTDNMRYKTGSTYSSDYGEYYVYSAAQSVCPTGWHLPTSAEFSSLVKAQGAANLTQAPANFTLGGVKRAASFDDVGESGFYMSATPNDTNAYYLRTDSTSASVPNNGAATTAMSVRCMAS